VSRETTKAGIRKHFRTPEFYFYRLVSLFRLMARFVTAKRMT